MMEVMNPGILTTIQDYGRLSYARMGVGKAGAIDGVSLHLANRLVGNPGNTPALEVSVMTPVKFLFHQDAWISVTGSNCTIVIDGRGQGWHGWRTFIKKGQTVELKPAYNSGMYSYLAVSGGFDAPEVMGSFSTDIKNRLGGHKGDGSPLQKGDHLTFGKPAHEIIQAVGVRAFSRTYISTSIFVLKGPEFEQFDAASQARFFEEEWEISSNSNRMGIRLEGDALMRDQPEEMRSQGVFEGVIQVPPSGQPLVLAAECQSTGGYPRIAVIPQAELWKLAYLPARKKVQFRLIDAAGAREKLEVQQQYLESVEYILARPNEIKRFIMKNSVENEIMKKSLKIDLNCDLGESFGPWRMGNDHAILPLITSANIACGFHAGDPETMLKTVELALENNVAVGAHPGFLDLQGFGRRNIAMSAREVYGLVVYQVGALQGFLSALGGELHHVKPHGALYNMAATDPVLAQAIAHAVADVSQGEAILYGLSGSELIKAGQALEIPVMNEVFSDRTYQEDRTLTSRREANALITDPKESISQVLQMIEEGTVTTTSGKKVTLSADTVCIHGDGVTALEFAKEIRETLMQRGIVLSADFA